MSDARAAVGGLQDRVGADHLENAPEHHAREREDGDALGLVPGDADGVGRDHLERKGAKATQRRLDIHSSDRKGVKFQISVMLFAYFMPFSTG